MFKSPGDVFLSIGSLDVYYYGVTMALGCLAGVTAAYLIFKKYNFNKNYQAITDVAVNAIIFGFLGARLYYCLLNFSYYFQHPLEILYFRQGGLSIHGGLIAGLIAIVITSKKNNLPVLSVLDAFVCGTALGQAIGRWGNFFNSEAFGYPTDLPWKLFIPLQNRPVHLMNFDYFHPTFLYESIFDLYIFIILYAAMKKFSANRAGYTLFIYLILYSCVRLFVEHFRIDSAAYIAGIPVAQIVSILLILLSVCGIIILKKVLYKSN